VHIAELPLAIDCSLNSTPIEQHFIKRFAVALFSALSQNKLLALMYSSTSAHSEATPCIR
jgi:hypothetical protein